MFGLLVRLVVLFAVVFGVVYGITRALRANAHSKEARRIRREIEALKVGIEQGLYTQDEYEQLAGRLKADCEREGIEVPALPEHIDGRERGEG
jgi:hypothetical protein